ncbi:MAG: sugar transferase, partial [Acidimicrobiales bacterium]
MPLHVGHHAWPGKRALDLTLSLLLLLVLILVLLSLAVAVKLSSRGPVLFRHRRVG